MAEHEIPTLSLEDDLTLSSTLSKQTLMIVDDYPNNLFGMKALFSNDYNVAIKDNGEDAIEYINTNVVDLILLDVDMPVMNGYEVCNILKTNTATRHIPIIFVTSAESVAEEQKGLLLGAVDYVIKPVNLNLLRARVSNHMQVVSDRKELEALSSLDGLTGIANRRQLDIMLKQNYASMIRSNENLSIIMLDIDDFKSYNDTYGHTKGDHCLKSVAQTIFQARRRDADTIGRYGGEEFAIILPNTEVEGALLIANDVLDRIRDLKLKHSGNSMHKIVTVSMGLVTFTSQQDNPQHVALEDLVNYADAQLYQAKKKGKNCVSYITV
ncbi:GGDEF domain-containing response regulator [Psychromonas arctica]|uniref:GGDEF domain-containing response regulator n=1 Tax=Psychromonas arctica TaxID=168275 RepID=UPI00040B508B|nr:diguanylate cyclase [Psychromonas arctica]